MNAIQTTYLYMTSLVIGMLAVLSLAQERTDDTFFVKPGAGTLSVQAELKKYTCKFAYAAQGGTHEEWFISLELLDGGSAVMCTVERSSTSYLFFQDFEMKLTGPLVSISDVDVKDSKRENLNVEKEGYELTQTSIKSKQGVFKNHLEKVAVYSPLPREDL